MSLEHALARQTAPRKRGRKPRSVDPDVFADRWLTPQEAASFLGIAVQSLAHDRVGGKLGIEYAKFRQSDPVSALDIAGVVAGSGAHPGSGARSSTRGKPRTDRAVRGP